ncbi:MAG: hypothetical protein ABIH39_00345 [Candidatus Margulisiibacteriota bacterium]
MFRSFILLLFILLFYSCAFAGTAVDLLAESISVRALGMGGAFTAIADSAAAPASNTAGLAKLRGAEIISTSFSGFDGDVSRISFDAAYPIWGGVSGFNIIQEGVSDIPYTRDINGQPDQYGSFNSSYRCYNFSYARELISDQTYAGCNIKYYSAELATGNASGFGIDAGIIHRLNQSLALALSVKNIIPVSLSWSTGHTDEIPLKVIAGAGYSLQVLGRALLIGADMELLVNNRSSAISYGAEYCVWQQESINVSVRLGKNRLEQLTAGLGLVYNRFTLDYAYWNHDLGVSSQIAFGYRL